MAQTQFAEYDLDVAQDFDARPLSVTEARRWVRNEMDKVGLAHRRRVVELLTTELASNAIMHVGGPFRLRLAFDGHLVRVEVADASTDIPREAPGGVDALSGRGYALVRRLSRRSGVDVHPAGKTVWFEVDAFRQFTNSNGA